MRKLRLHLATEERQFKPLPEIEAALDYWKDMNNMRNTWARFEACEFPSGLIIRVSVGAHFHKGTDKEFKEIAFKVRSFFVNDKGEVEYHDTASF